MGTDRHQMEETDREKAERWATEANHRLGIINAQKQEIEKAFRMNQELIKERDQLIRRNKALRHTLKVLLEDDDG